ncbi:Nucleoid occlusion protein [Thauera mechernichensis]
MYPNKIPLSKIVVGNNPRRFFDPAKMNELVSSIREKDVIQPILVRPLNDGFEVVAGGRRYTAAKLAHGDDYEIPVVVRDLTDAEAEELALIENVQRSDMSPAEEAEAAAKILARCDGDREDAAKRLGWTRSTLDKRLALMNCAQAVRDALVERKIKLGHAELIAGLSKDKQEGVLNALLKAPELVSVAELKVQIQKLANALSAAIFDKTDCAGCPHNSGNQQALFGEAVDDGHCTNRDCWNAKTDQALEAKRESLKDEFPEVRIVRPGENFTVIKLVAEGATGVGEDQAQACRSCGKYGAAISAVPGKVGNVFRGLCFDAQCNMQKVKAQQESTLAAVTAAAEKPAGEGVSTSGAAKAGSAGKTAQKAEKKPTAVQDSTRVKDYRVKVWRKALAKHLASNPQQNERVLIALAMTGEGRNISDKTVKAVYKALTQQDVPPNGKPEEIFVLLADASDEVVVKLLRTLAPSVAEGIDEFKLVALMKTLRVDLTAYWKLNEEYLNLLTKSEIEVIAEQVGIKEHLGKDYAKLMAGKKDEIVKKILTVDGFEYAGKLPGNMLYGKK